MGVNLIDIRVVASSKPVQKDTRTTQNSPFHLTLNVQRVVVNGDGHPMAHLAPFNRMGSSTYHSHGIFEPSLDINCSDR
jgi:hypothetical protein